MIQSDYSSKIPRKMTSIRAIKKEYTRIMRARRGKPLDLARRYASGAYLALELGFKKRAEIAVDRSVSAFQEGMIATTKKAKYRSLLREQKLVEKLQECHKRRGRYWDSPKEEQYFVGLYHARNMHNFLKILREEISSDSLEFIAGQKGWVNILGGQVDFWDSAAIETFFGQLTTHKDETGQPPVSDFPKIPPAVDTGYNTILKSCSEGQVYSGRRLKIDLFRERFERIEAILETSPSHKLVMGWLQKKIDDGYYSNASIIIELNGIKKKDIKIKQRFEDYLPKVCSFKSRLKDYDYKAFSFNTKGWNWMKENTSSKVPVDKIRSVYRKMIKLKKEEGMSVCVGDMSTYLDGSGRVYAHAPTAEFWDEKIDLVHKITGVKPPVVRTIEKITFEK